MTTNNKHFYFVTFPQTFFTLISTGHLSLHSILVIAIGLAIWTSTNKKEVVEDDNLKIVTSFYPIYIMTANITRDIPDVELLNMSEANVGCLHDYTISTTDMKKIENYKNSKYFIQTVRNARMWEKSEEKLIIIAGACESFFEAIMLEGANFASSPARIMIEYRDPLIIASKIAYTDSNKYVSINDLKPYLKSNYNGMGGTRAKGKKNGWQKDKK